MLLLNGHPLALDAPFTGPDGTQYPANWTRLATPEERAAIGITEVADPELYDDRFFWSPGQPKDLAQVKAHMIGQVKNTAACILAVSDWKVVRAAEGVKPVDADTLAFRAAVRAASNNFEAAISSCASVEQLAALRMEWPQQPKEEA